MAGDNVTPLMRQFWSIKAEHPDKILFFRMGDFYEMFGDDAVRAAPLLGITLTSRSHGESERIPLAGVPYHAAERYLARLMEAGEKVVIVEQTEDPRHAKGLVKREVVEIMTPGTSLLEQTPAEVATLAALSFVHPKAVGVAALQLATGRFVVEQGDLPRMVDQIRTIAPAELLLIGPVPDSDHLKHLMQEVGESRISRIDPPHSSLSANERLLCEQLGVAALSGFGIDQLPAAIHAAAMVVQYVRDQHRAQLAHVDRIARLGDQGSMQLDYATTRNLELVKNLAGGGEELTLYSVLNRCHTAAGSRLLRSSLLRPFLDRIAIERRQQAIAELLANRPLASSLRHLTRDLPDLEKLVGRLGVGAINPRQVQAIGQGSGIAGQLKQLLLQSARSPHLMKLAESMPSIADVADLVEAALTPHPPAVTSKGELIREGYSSELDALNHSIADARAFIASLQESERAKTGISSLKVGFNQIFGYYLEITRANAALVPASYIRKQTLVNAERYITPELKEKEALIAAAEEKIFELEARLFAELVQQVTGRLADLLLAARLLAELDLVAALADVAAANSYVRPELFDDDRLEIVNGRHPVIETVLPRGAFVPNDLQFTAESYRLIVLTGPNMSGKSTWLRQLGLLVIMAQIGSYVPAEAARIGLVDRVFTRVGALDNLARGQSTFLVEMLETANILNSATERSLVLLDEVGRGTSTFDGLSIAWSVAEHLAEQTRCRAIFATHYHELTGLAIQQPRVANFQVAVKRWEDRVLFLHTIVPGGCDDSYGIDVARLAGLPRPTISRARQLLKLLESGKFSQSEIGRSIYQQKRQTSLFEEKESPLLQRLREVDIDSLTPLAAFDLLREIVAQAGSE